MKDLRYSIISNKLNWLYGIKEKGGGEEEASTELYRSFISSYYY